LRLLAFLLGPSTADSSSGVRYFPSVSAIIRAFLSFEVVNLVVVRDAYTGITTFTIVAVTVKEYYHTEIPLYWN